MYVLTLTCTWLHGAHPYTHEYTVFTSYKHGMWFSPATYAGMVLAPTHMYRCMVLTSTHKDVWYSPSPTYRCPDPPHVHTYIDGW